MILVIDVGTTGLRAAVVRPDGSLAASEHRPCGPVSPFPGLVEFDATTMAALVLDAARAVLHRLGDPPLEGVGIAAQRASTIVWDRATGRPIAPALGWQDLRTVGECITAKAEHGLPLAPNQSATKLAWLLANAAGDRSPDGLCFGTVDTWIAWTLSEGSVHVTDHTNAAVTGLYSVASGDWNERTCEVLGIPTSLLPTIADTSGVVGAATAIPGAPPIAALVGDQQGSLVGQGCIAPGMAKVTFGTGGMLDLCTGPQPPAVADRTPHGTFPIVAWSMAGERTWGSEAIMLSAGSNVEWLQHDLGVLATPAESHAVAAACDGTDGVVYVPALLGLGTPQWDYGARGTLLGVTRGTGRPQVVRAVLEGVAHRGADLVESAEADSGLSIPTLRVDGGMSANPTFVQALADASGKPVEVSPVVEATTLGAAYLAGVAVGEWPDLATACAVRAPARVVEPTSGFDREAARATWRRAIGRAERWIPELSALDF
jgi:glycerol kinase